MTDASVKIATLEQELENAYVRNQFLAQELDRERTLHRNRIVLYDEAVKSGDAWHARVLELKDELEALQAKYDARKKQEFTRAYGQTAKEVLEVPADGVARVEIAPGTFMMKTSEIADLSIRAANYTRVREALGADDAANLDLVLAQIRKLHGAVAEVEMLTHHVTVVHAALGLKEVVPEDVVLTCIHALRTTPRSDAYSIEKMQRMHRRAQAAERRAHKNARAWRSQNARAEWWKRAALDLLGAVLFPADVAREYWTIDEFSFMRAVEVVNSLRKKLGNVMDVCETLQKREHERETLRSLEEPKSLPRIPRELQERLEVFHGHVSGGTLKESTEDPLVLALDVRHWVAKNYPPASLNTYEQAAQDLGVLLNQVRVVATIHRNVDRTPHRNDTKLVRLDDLYDLVRAMQGDRS